MPSIFFKKIPFNFFMLIVVICIGWKTITSPLFFLAAAMMPLAVIVAIRYSILMVLLFVAFSFFRLHEVIPFLFSFKIPFLLSLASLLALVWHMFITKKINPFLSYEMTPFIIFWFLVAIGIIFSSNRTIAVEYFKHTYWKIIVMTLAITWFCQTHRDFDLTNKIILISGLLVACVAMSNMISGNGLVEGTRVTIGRDIGSILGDPNDLALVLMFPLAFSASMVVTKNVSTVNFYLGVISLPLLFWAIIATQSRGGLLGALAVTMFFGWRQIKSKILFFILSVATSIFLFILAGITDRKSGGASEQGLDASAEGRLYAWEAAIGMGLDNPLTGVGLDNFYSNYFYYSSHWDGLNHAVHSTWFGIFSEAGVLGFLVFIWAIFRLVKSSYKSMQITSRLNHDHAVLKSTATALFAGLIGTLVSATFLTQGFTWPLYILTALIIALSRLIHLKQIQHSKLSLSPGFC